MVTNLVDNCISYEKDTQLCLDCDYKSISNNSFIYLNATQNKCLFVPKLSVLFCKSYNSSGDCILCDEKDDQGFFLYLSLKTC